MQDLQDYAACRVPENEGPRFKWLYLTNVENAVTVCVPVLMFGAFLGSAMTAGSLLLALGLSGLFLALLSSWTSTIGVKTRLSTALLVRRSFGETGAKIVWLILALSLFGWFGVQTELFAKAFALLMQKTMPEIAISKTVLTLLSGALMASTAIVGIKGVGKLAQLATPLLLGVLGYALYEAVASNGLSAWLDAQPEKPMAIGTAVASIVGAYSVGAIVMPDIKRYAKNVGHSVWSAVLALGLFYPFLLLLTALTSVLTKQSDFMELLVTYGFGSFSLVILMLATWTTNDLNLYSASLSLAPVFPKVPRVWLTAASGALGTVIALFGVFERLIPLFSLLGVATTPLVVIYSFDYLSGKLDREEEGAKKIQSTSFAVWILASFVGIATTPADQMGLGLMSLTTVPGLDSLIAAVVLVGLLRLASCVKTRRVCANTP